MTVSFLRHGASEAWVIFVCLFSMSWICKESNSSNNQSWCLCLRLPYQLAGFVGLSPRPQVQQPPMGNCGPLASPIPEEPLWHDVAPGWAYLRKSNIWRPWESGEEPANNKHFWGREWRQLFEQMGSKATLPLTDFSPFYWGIKYLKCIKQVCLQCTAPLMFYMQGSM